MLLTEMSSFLRKFRLILQNKKKCVCLQKKLEIWNSNGNIVL